MSVEFATASVAVDSTAGVATIEVERTGNPNAVVSVNYATSNGTAIAGINYVAASGILTFLAGQDRAVLFDHDPAQLEPDRVHDNGQYGAEPADRGRDSGPDRHGGPDDQRNTRPPAASPRHDRAGGHLGAAHRDRPGDHGPHAHLQQGSSIRPARSTSSNYGYYVFSEGDRYTAGATYTSLSSAVYNSAANTVTLYPSSPLPLNQFFEITVDGQASPLLNNGLTDLAGNQLAGSSGARGTPLFLTFAAGTKLAYTDGGNNAVSLQLTKGGVMEMFLSPLGVVEQLQLAGTVPGKSTLNGSVRRSRGGTGRAVLPAIGGSAGVRIRLKTPPFYFRATPPIDAKIAADAGRLRSSQSPRAACGCSRRQRQASRC